MDTPQQQEQPRSAGGAAAAAAAAALRQHTIDLRRRFHAVPELAFEERQTADMIAAELLRLGVQFRRGVGGTGVVATVQGSAPQGDAQRAIMFRADMDGLPLREETGLEFAATNGRMHACGHDGHLAIGLSAAACLQELRGRFAGAAHFVFQPAEEVGGGARAMLEDGALEAMQPAPQRAVSLHIANMVDAGTVCVNSGLTFSAASMFRVAVNGRGGHAAAPHNLADPVVAAAHIVAALQSVVSRNTPPDQMGVLTIGSINGGFAPNVVPDQVLLEGTARAHSDSTLASIMDAARRVAEGTAAAMGVQADLSVQSLVPAVVNDPAAAEEVRAAVRSAAPGMALAAFEPQGYGDDVSEFLNRIPGAYFILGGGPHADPHHNAKFNFDEGCLEGGVAIVAAAMLDHLC